MNSAFLLCCNMFKDLRDAQTIKCTTPTLLLFFLSFSFRLQGTNGNQQTPISTATVSMVHSVPELMVSAEVSHDGYTWKMESRQAELQTLSIVRSVCVCVHWQHTAPTRCNILHTDLDCAFYLVSSK